PSAGASCYRGSLPDLSAGGTQFLCGFRVPLGRGETGQFLVHLGAFVLRGEHLRQVPARRRVARIPGHRLAEQLRRLAEISLVAPGHAEVGDARRRRRQLARLVERGDRLVRLLALAFDETEAPPG